MSDVQRVVDELRFMLQREVVEKSDELINLVTAYSQYCHETNVRLRKCDDYVRQGLRSEALHLAEAAPNLLETVAVLDFAERDELVELLSMYFLAIPEPLMIEAASSLNEAYADHEPLQKLLDLHRVLAIGRGPLAQRLIVLRSLADLDASSAHWDLDIRDMERARFRELEAEALAATRSGNMAVFKSLVSEIQAEGWREAIPASLTRELKSRAAQSLRSNARLRMEQLNEQLYAAFSALDANAARPLRDEWKLKRSIVQVADNDPLCDQVAPIFDWLDDEDRKASDERAFSKVVADIERALDSDDVTSGDLKQLKHAAERLERGLPALLETRFRSRVNTIESIEGRRRKLVIGAGVGGFAIVAGIFALIVYQSMEGEKTRRLVAAVSAYIDDGKLTEALKLVEQQASQSTSEAWLTVKKKLADAEQAERDRITVWKSEVARARESTDMVLVEAALKQARELSRTADEKIEVGQIQSTWQRRVNEAIAVREKSFREAIASASDALKDLDTELGSQEVIELDRIQPLLNAAESKIGRLQPLRDSVAKELRSQAVLLESRLKASQQTIADIAKKAELLNKITDAVLILPGAAQAAPDQGRYEATLKEFATALPNDPRAAIMKSAAESSPLPAVMARKALVDRWKRFRPGDKKDAETRLRELRAFFTDHPQSPDREILAQYEKWLVTVLRRYADDGDPDEGVQQRLHILFNSRFIKEGHVLQDTDHRTYYLTKPQTANFGSVASITYQVGFNGETNQITMKPEKLLTPRSISPPQQEIAAKVRAAIKNVALDGWRDYFHELTETLLKTDKIDPFLRYLLVLKTVEFAGRGDYLLELDLAPLLEKLSDNEIDRSVPWMDPISKSAEAARVRASEILANLPPIEPIFTSATKRQEQFERSLFALRFSVGWIEKTSSGEWVCRTKWSPTGEHTLHVVTRADASGSRSWSTLGRIQGDSITVDPAVAQAVGEAAVVFAASPTADAKTVLVR